MSTASRVLDVPQTVTRACTESAGTVQALAQEIGVSYAALCSWSRGRRQPPPHRLRRLADVLDDRADRLRDIAAELRAHTDAVAPRPAPQPVPLRATQRVDGRIPFAPPTRPAAAENPAIAARPRSDGDAHRTIALSPSP